MKGAPWIPEVSGSDVCDSTDESGASTSCQTFNSADAEHIKSLGYVSCERSEYTVSLGRAKRSAKNVLFCSGSSHCRGAASLAHVLGLTRRR
jgi:hypothetical protein